MTKYDIIFESLQEKVNSGELTIEDAEILNDVAFEKYGEDDAEYEEVTESADEEDEGVTYEQYLEAMEEELFGEATRLAKEIHKHHNDTKKQLNDVKQSQKSLLDDDFDADIELEKSRRKRELRDKIFTYRKYDTIDNGKKVAKDLKQRTISSAIDKDQNMNTGIGRKIAQQNAFNTLPSEKSLENRPVGRFIKKK